MIIIKSRSTAIVFLAIFFAILNGCAHKEANPESPGTTRSEKPAKPERTKVSAATKIDPTNALLTFVSSGAPMHVSYEMSVDEESCEGFKRVGKVFHSGREVLLPWIAKVTEGANKGLMRAHTKINKTVPGNQLVQIRAQSSWGGGSCGPLAVKFIPEPSKSYRIDFAFAGNSACSQRVLDITDPSEEKMVAVQPIEPCSKW